jgi:hypothetical protein
MGEQGMYGDGTQMWNDMMMMMMNLGKETTRRRSAIQRDQSNR